MFNQSPMPSMHPTPTTTYQLCKGGMQQEDALWMLPLPKRPDGRRMMPGRDRHATWRTSLDTVHMIPSRTSTAQRSADSTHTPATTREKKESSYCTSHLPYISIMSELVIIPPRCPRFHRAGSTLQTSETGQWQRGWPGWCSQ